MEKETALGSAVLASVVSSSSAVMAASATLAATGSLSTPLPTVEADAALPMSTDIFTFVDGAENMTEAALTPSLVKDTVTFSLPPESTAGIEPPSGLADSTHDEL